MIGHRNGTFAEAPARPPLDKAAEKWVQDTLKRMTLDEKVGQLLAPSIDAMVTSTDSDVYQTKLHLVRDLKVGRDSRVRWVRADAGRATRPNYRRAGAPVERATRSRPRRSSIVCSRPRPSRS